MGSGHTKVGRRTQSLVAGGLLSGGTIEAPDGGSVTSSARTLVFERRSGVGSWPSIQMYSAWYATGFLSAVIAVVGVFTLCQQAISRPYLNVTECELRRRHWRRIGSVRRRSPSKS